MKRRTFFQGFILVWVLGMATAAGASAGKNALLENLFKQVTSLLTEQQLNFSKSDEIIFQKIGDVGTQGDIFYAGVSLSAAYNYTIALDPFAGYFDLGANPYLALDADLLGNHLNIARFDVRVANYGRLYPEEVYPMGKSWYDPNFRADLSLFNVILDSWGPGATPSAGTDSKKLEAKLDEIRRSISEQVGLEPKVPIAPGINLGIDFGYNSNFNFLTQFIAQANINDPIQSKLGISFGPAFDAGVFLSVFLEIDAIIASLQAGITGTVTLFKLGAAGFAAAKLADASISVGVDWMVESMLGTVDAYVTGTLGWGEFSVSKTWNKNLFSWAGIEHSEKKVFGIMSFITTPFWTSCFGSASDPNSPDYEPDCTAEVDDLKAAYGVGVNSADQAMGGYAYTHGDINCAGVTVSPPACDPWSGAECRDMYDAWRETYCRGDTYPDPPPCTNSLEIMMAFNQIARGQPASCNPNLGFGGCPAGYAPFYFNSPGSSGGGGSGTSSGEWTTLQELSTTSATDGGVAAEGGNQAPVYHLAQPCIQPTYGAKTKIRRESEFLSSIMPSAYATLEFWDGTCCCEYINGQRQCPGGAHGGFPVINWSVDQGSLGGGVLSKPMDKPDPANSGQR
jgi:hypothetical protein